VHTLGSNAPATESDSSNPGAQVSETFSNAVEWSTKFTPVHVGPALDVGVKFGHQELVAPEDGPQIQFHCD
jgi:hypothetical protein